MRLTEPDLIIDINRSVKCMWACCLELVRPSLNNEGVGIMRKARALNPVWHCFTKSMLVFNFFFLLLLYFVFIHSLFLFLLPTCSMVKLTFIHFLQSWIHEYTLSNSQQLKLLSFTNAFTDSPHLS